MAGRMVKDHGRKWERETNAHLCGWEAEMTAALLENPEGTLSHRVPVWGWRRGMGNYLPFNRFNDLNSSIFHSVKRKGSPNNRREDCYGMTDSLQLWQCLSWSVHSLYIMAYIMQLGLMV